MDSDTDPELGAVFTKGRSYRARAEARQRELRSKILREPPGRYGHWLTAEAAAKGRNFVCAEAFEAALARQRAGKGVAPRTFENMLASQAMCFNVFTPLANDVELATRILRPFLPALERVESVVIEHTPDASIFGDQSGQSGVDCDVLIEGRLEGNRTCVIALETKFVEKEFSTCGFRRAGRASRGKDVCSDLVQVGARRDACLYVANRGYRYWERSDELGVLADGALAPAGCPFAGPHWQLWVNRVLAEAEARERGADRAFFAVVAPSANDRLLRGGVLGSFCALLREPASFVHIDLDALLEHVGALAKADRTLAVWSLALTARYGAI